MKKLAIAIIFALLLTGCANDQYAVERQYWNVEKQAEKIFRNPYASPPYELEKAVRLLSDFARKYPKNNLSIEAEFNIARLYIVKKEYDKARAHLQMMLNKYSALEAVSSEALFLTGNSYEAEDKWGLALEQYRKIIRSYPVTPRGIDIPIYIAQHYKIKHEPDKMISAYEDAISHYQALAEKYPGSGLAFKAHNLVPRCYVLLQDWQNAVNSFNAIIENYKGKVNLDFALMEMALIYNRRLNDKAKAKEALGRLIKEYPDSKLVKAAGALLKEMDKK